VSTITGWTEVAITSEKGLDKVGGFEKVEVPKNGRITDLLGVLGTYFLSIIPALTFCLSSYKTCTYNNDDYHGQYANIVISAR